MVENRACFEPGWAPSYTDISRVLGGARRREGRIVLLTAGALGLSGAGLSALAGALALSRGLGSAAAAQRLALGSAALALLAAAAWAGVALLRRASSPEATARFLGRAEPALRSDLLSAVELWRDRGGLAAAGYSLALADAHVERTAARVAGVDLARALPATPARRAGLVLGAVLAAHLVALAVAGRSLGAGYAALAGLGPRPPAPPAEPITGDVELTYQYPAHTGRPPRIVSGTGGEITAPKGTEVRIAAPGRPPGGGGGAPPRARRPAAPAPQAGRAASRGPGGGEGSAVRAAGSGAPGRGPGGEGRAGARRPARGRGARHLPLPLPQGAQGAGRGPAHAHHRRARRLPRGAHHRPRARRRGRGQGPAPGGLGRPPTTSGSPGSRW